MQENKYQNLILYRLFGLKEAVNPIP